MAYPEHFLLQWGGTLRGDIWSCGVRMVNENEPLGLDAADQQARAVALTSCIQTLMATSAGGWSIPTILTYVKFNKINSAGEYDDPSASHVNFLTTPTGGFNTATLSNSDALAVSWVTSATRGPASKGRIFVPCPGGTITASTGKYSGSLAVANAHATFINCINNDPALSVWDLKASVVSNVGSGSSRPIIGVRVGDIMDTQRRRRNALVELYTTNTTAIV